METSGKKATLVVQFTSSWVEFEDEFTSGNILAAFKTRRSFRKHSDMVKATKAEAQELGIQIVNVDDRVS